MLQRCSIQWVLSEEVPLWECLTTGTWLDATVLIFTVPYAPHMALVTFLLLILSHLLCSRLGLLEHVRCPDEQYHQLHLVGQTQGFSSLDFALL
jgi:hypothetical protein